MRIEFRRKSPAAVQLTASHRREMAVYLKLAIRPAWVVFVCWITLAANGFASQGAVRTLYTVPNTSFVEQAGGENIVTINDTSGSIASVQAAINSARGANPNSVIVIYLLRGATYSVNAAGLVLGSHECLVAEGVLIQSANSSVTVPLITIASGSTDVSVAGGTLEGRGANTQAIFAPAASRVNIDQVIVRNFGQDGIFLAGNGNSTYDNEITVTRADVSGNQGAGIRIENSTQTALLDNNCHDNTTGIRISAAWANVANNTCHDNTIGIDIAGGNDNIVANNTSNNNGTGIHAGGTGGMIVSNSLGGNSSAGISSTGTSNNFIDNLFTSGNAVNFMNGGKTDNIIAYKAPVSASGQNYFYPPLIDNQHADSTIVNGMGRTDVTVGSTTIDNVQSQYNAARSANPNNVIVLHLNGAFVVGANPLTLSSNTSVLLNGTIQINSSTIATAAIATPSGATRISISGGTLDGGNRESHTGISAISSSMIQVDGMTIQNFGDNSSHHSGSDSIHFSGGATPYVVTRCTINKSGARGIWSQLSHQKALYSNNSVTFTRACIDADSHTFGSVMMYNFCDSNTYGLFIEQGAAHNTAIGNVSNNSARKDITVFNNNDTPPVEFNSVLANTIRGGGTGIQSGSTPAGIFTSDNFIFDNVVVNTPIQSQASGTQNYYSQNYLLGGTLSTSGSEAFFNSVHVSGNLQIHDSNSGMAVIVQDASTTDGAPVVTALPSSLGNGSNDDEWRFIPTTNGYYRIMNGNSGMTMVVQDASLADGATVAQSAYTADTTFNDEWLIQPAGNGLYNIVNRLSGLYLDVSGSSTSLGAQLIQAQSNGAANQQFSLTEDVPVPDFSITVSPASQAIAAGGSASYTISISGTSGFDDTVDLSVTGLPDGAAPSFSSGSIAGGSGSSILNVSTSIPSGTYAITITGTDSLNGRITHSTAVVLTITPASLSVTSSGLLFSRVTHTYQGTITVFNNTSNTYTGPLFVTLSELTAGVNLLNGSAAVGGLPAIQLVPEAATLAPGASVTVPVIFNDPSNARITFTPILEFQQ